MYSLIDNKAGRIFRIDNRKHCLQKSVVEKIAMLRIMRGDYTETVNGCWIGDRHFVVALDRDEYNNLLEMKNRENS